MNWIKENPFVAGVAAAALLVLIGLGFLLSQSIDEYLVQEENYTAKVKELHALQEQTPYPNTKNLEAIRGNVQDYKKHLIQLEEVARKRLPAVPEKETPQEFQDELRKVVSAVTQKAKDAKTTLPDNFYLGFDIYATSLPQPEAAAPLSRQLAAIRWIFEKIIESGVSKVNSFTRGTLPSETPGGSPPAAKPANAKPQEVKASEIIQKNKLTISLTGEQVRMRRALNELVTSPQFLIIRALDFQNSALKGPLKVSATDKANAATANPGGELANVFGAAAGKKNADDLPILLGRETITGRLVLELLDFTPLNLK